MYKNENLALQGLVWAIESDYFYYYITNKATKQGLKKVHWEKSTWGSLGFILGEIAKKFRRILSNFFWPILQLEVEQA